jgi:uncharacterized membrane protein HdeD (DUF308 family)
MHCPPIMKLAPNGWSMLVLRGAASLVFGLLALASPPAALAALALLFGLYALVDGLTSAFFALSVRQDRRWSREHGQPPHVSALAARRAPKWYLARAFFGVGAGLIAFLFPHVTAFSLSVLVGLWAVAAGVTELALARRLHHLLPRVAGLVVAGTVTLAFGLALLVMPFFGVFALSGVVAFLAILSGLASIGVAARLHDELDVVHA